MLAVVPVKGRDGAKTRLAPLLEPEERTRLVLDMLERVLEACAGAESITGTLLVTPDPGFAPGGVELLRDAGTGHADAIALALRDERALGGSPRRDGRLPVRSPASPSTRSRRLPGPSPSPPRATAA